MSLSKFMKGATVLALGAAVSWMAVGTASAEMPAPKKQFMSLATSSVGGSWFPLGGAMASVVSKHYPNLNITAEVTGGTNDNLKLVMNKKVELALSTNSQAYLAYKGEGAFAKSGKITNMRGLLGGHMIKWQLYTLKANGITKITDLKGGKRVSLGASGSIGNSIGKLVIEAHGPKMNTDWKPEYIGHGDGPGALRDGRVDAVLIISSTPTSAVTDITSVKGSDVVFIMPDAAILDGLIKDRPYWSKAEIPAGVYKAVDKAIPGSFGVSTIMVALDTISDAAAYAFVKAILENPDQLSAANKLGKAWHKGVATRGVKGVVPFHPGAEAYLKEKGLF